MELLQLLKALGDQSSQANMIDQVKLLNENIAVLHANEVRLAAMFFWSWSILLLMIIAMVYSTWKLNKRLKKIEWEVEKLDRKAWRGYYQDKDEAEAREKFTKDVLLNKVSCVEKPD